MIRQLVLLAAIAAPLGAAADDPYGLGDYRLAFLDDPLRVALPAGVTGQNVRYAIGVAASREGWLIESETPGSVRLGRTVRDKHQIKLEVAYEAGGYAMRYVDSVNMLYREALGGARAIHKNYNVWIGELATAINLDLGVPEAKIIAGFASVEDVRAVPYLRPKEREAYAVFLSKPKPRAFAVAPSGTYGYAWGNEANSNLNRVARALEICKSHSDGCRLYAVDDTVVWGGELGGSIVAGPATAPIAPPPQIRTPLPESIRIEPPGPDAGPSAQVLSGAWVGTWSGNIEHTLVIEKIEDGTATFVFSWNLAQFKSTIAPAGWLRVKGPLDKDGVLRGTVGVAAVAYRLSGDGRLVGEYTRDGRVTPGTFERVALTPGAAGTPAEALPSAADASVRLLVVRRNDFFGGGVTYSIFIGSEEAATLKTAEYAEIPVPPGAREISARCRGPFGLPVERPIRFSARAGERLFFALGGGCVFDMISEGTAKELLSGSTRVNSSRPH